MQHDLTNYRLQQPPSYLFNKKSLKLTFDRFGTKGFPQLQQHIKKTVIKQQENDNLQVERNSYQISNDSPKSLNKISQLDYGSRSSRYNYSEHAFNKQQFEERIGDHFKPQNKTSRFQKKEIKIFAQLNNQEQTLQNNRYQSQGHVFQEMKFEKNSYHDPDKIFTPKIKNLPNELHQFFENKEQKQNQKPVVMGL